MEGRWVARTTRRAITQHMVFINARPLHMVLNKQNTYAKGGSGGCLAYRGQYWF